MTRDDARFCYRTPAPGRLLAKWSNAVAFGWRLGRRADEYRGKAGRSAGAR
jgi:hypothetical protein